MKDMLQRRFRQVQNTLRFSRIQRLIAAEGDTWEGEIEGLPCKLSRHPRGRHWTGRVQVPAYHRYHGKKLSVCIKTPQCLPKVVDFLKPPNNEIWECAHRLGAILKTKNGLPHGGIVIAGERTDSEGWWWGFDCGHQDDLSPGIMEVPNIKQIKLPDYRTKVFALGELKKLAALVKATGAHA